MPTRQSTITPADVLLILRDHPRRWVVPAIALALVAAAYALVKPTKWEASQALLVRDEAMGAPIRPGKFQQLDDMKTVQETILELARSRTVLRGALTEIGPDSKHDGSIPWPTEGAVSALAGSVKLSPPKGAEFGKTEVFYLHVEAETPKRAVLLADAICKHLHARSQDLRDQKAGGLVAELTKTVELAKTDLTATTTELTKIETHVGSDLGELRVLDDVGGGDSPLRRSINEMELELRQAKQAIDANQELLSLLKTSKADTTSLLAAPNRLLEAQPVLRRLKDGMVDAQLRTAQLSGNMSESHPLVQAAKISEGEIGDHVRQELDSAIRGGEIELRLSQDRAKSLDKQLADARSRLSNLAGMRAEYANVVSERNRRVDILKSAEQQLSEARASQAAAHTTSIITAIDGPVAADSPAGPGKASLVAGGGFGGLILGLAIVFLTVNSVPSAASEQAAFGAGSNLVVPRPRKSSRLSDLYNAGLSLKQALSG
jgi:polysaccharide biosynthesis transport protein